MRPGWWLSRAKLRPKHSRIPSIINSSLRKLFTAKTFDTVFVNPAIPRMSQLLIYPAASAWVTSFGNLLIDLFFHRITVLTTEQFVKYVCYQTPKGVHQLTTTKEKWHATLFRLADLSPDMWWIFRCTFYNEMAWDRLRPWRFFCHSRPQNRLSPFLPARWGLKTRKRCFRQQKF